MHFALILNSYFNVIKYGERREDNKQGRIYIRCKVNLFRYGCMEKAYPFGTGAWSASAKDN